MKFLFRRRERSDTISTLYGTIVAQARLPCFYREYGVPDTVNGRFDLLVLHLALVLDRLADEPQLRELVQALERNIYGQGAASRTLAARLAAYMRRTVGELRVQPASQVLVGKLIM